MRKGDVRTQRLGVGRESRRPAFVSGSTSFVETTKEAFGSVGETGSSIFSSSVLLPASIQQSASTGNRRKTNLLEQSVAILSLE